MNKNLFQDPAASEHRILILDLYGEVPAYLEYLLLFLGRRTTVAKSVKALGAEMETCAVDIIFMGWRSGENGLIQSLRQGNPGVLCFIVARRGDVLAELVSIDIGADGCLELPTTFSELDSFLKKNAIHSSKPGWKRTTENRCWDDCLSFVPEEPKAGLMRLSPLGHFLWFNDRFCEILGHSRAELRDRTIIEIAHPEYVREVTALLPPLIGERKALPLCKKAILVHKNGAWIPVDFHETEFFIKVLPENQIAHGDGRGSQPQISLQGIEPRSADFDLTIKPGDQGCHPVVP